MKAYFLLERGNVFHTVLEELRPAMAERPCERLDLSAALQHATSGEPADPHLQRLRLRLLPCAPMASTYDCWCGLTPTLSVPWPLQLLLQPRLMDRYEELARFLLVVKRVQLELQAAWTTQAHFGRLPVAQRALLMPLCKLRAHMAFLIDNLQYYLQVDVLEAHWQAFMRVAETCGDFEVLSSAHETCLAALHAQCFLQTSSVVAALREIFQVRHATRRTPRTPRLLCLCELDWPSRCGNPGLLRAAVLGSLPNAPVCRPLRASRSHVSLPFCDHLAGVHATICFPFRVRLQHGLAPGVAAPLAAHDAAQLQLILSAEVSKDRHTQGNPVMLAGEGHKRVFPSVPHPE